MMDSADFHARVYEAIRRVPYGRVTSYKHIAVLVGMPNHSRHVGQALRFLPADSNVPWHRVIASNGTISSRGPGADGAQRQRDRLFAEGVDVRDMPGGEMKVSWAEHGWFPDTIDLEDPPEANADAGGEGDEESDLSELSEEESELSELSEEEG